ncbi:MAG: tetratricopeptide repeat protein [Terriglobales bacterium]
MSESATGASVEQKLNAEGAAGAKPQRGSGPDAARVLVVLALLLAALSYVNTLRANFVYDDFPQIVNNPRVHTWAHGERVFSEHVWSQLIGQPGNYYRPIFIFWLMGNYSLFGLHPMGWHATTVLLHLLVTGMVYVLLRRLTRDRVMAGIGTVIWAMHPTHIETVAWISGVPDSLLGIFLIGSFLTFVRAREAEQRRGWWMAASVVLYALGMMSKETGMMLPLILLAYDWLLAPKSEGEHANWSKLIWRYLPYALAALAYLEVRRLVLGQISYPEEKPWLPLLLTVPSLLWFYVRELFWPVNLSVFHDYPLVQRIGLVNFWLPLLGVSAFVAAAVWLARKSRQLAFAACWMAVLMIPPILGIYAFIPEDLVHDRYLYLPTIGFTLAVAWAIRRIPDIGPVFFGGPVRQMALTLALGVAMAISTVMQNAYWTNDLILYAHSVQVAPNNVVAINHMANEFYKRGDPGKAMALYQRSLRVKPHWATYFAIGLTYYELGHYGESEKYLETAIPLLRGNPDEYYFLGMAQLQQRKYAKSEVNFRNAISVYDAKPGYHYALGIALEEQGKLPAARDEMRIEMQRYPTPFLKTELARVEQKMKNAK